MNPRNAVVIVCVMSTITLPGCGSMTPLGIDPSTLADTDADTDGDSDADSDADADAPQLTFFDVVQDANGVQVKFEVSDPQPDLEGGRFRLVIDSNADTYNIPGDIDSWNPGGTSSFTVSSLSGGSCGSSTTYNFEGTVFDAADNASAALTDSLQVGGGSLTATEGGDLYTDAPVLGNVAAGDTICGDIYATGADATGDVDWLQISSASSTSLTFSLTWTANNGDYDLFLYDYDTLVKLDTSNQGGNSQPEAITYTMAAGQPYYLVVVGWEGDSGPYSIQIY